MSGIFMRQSVLGAVLLGAVLSCSERSADNRSGRALGKKIGDAVGSGSSHPSTDAAPVVVEADASSLVVNNEVDAGTGMNPDSVATFALLSKTCKGCHPDFSNYTADGQWAQEGYVVAGKPEESKIMKRLKFSDVDPTQQHDMPREGEWTKDNSDQVKRWIVGMAATAEGPASKRRKAALEVLAKRCAGCHMGPQTAKSDRYAGATVVAFSDYVTDNAFVNAGLIFPKDVEHSWIYQSIKGIGTFKNIHQGNDVPIVFDEEAAVLRAWIAGI